MKISKFNFFCDFEKDDSKMIAYNSRANSLALIEKENYLKYQDFVNETKDIDDQKLVKDLEKGQFLIEDDINELDLLKYDMLASRFSNRSLNLTIAPTMNCNFSCIYCYEKDKVENLSMSQEVQDKLIEYIEKNSDHVDSIHIGWYGGEPLLEFDIIEYISKKVIEICEKKNVRYTSGIITNGYKLNSNIVGKLKDLNIEFLQITLDGPADIHDKRRPLKNGKETFYKIITNISENIENLPKVSLRVNVDKENFNRVDDILDVLDEYNLRKKVDVYLGYVEPTNDCYSVDTCLAFSQYSQIDLKFQEKLIQRGFANNMTHKYPRLVTNYCGADSISSLVIGANGDMYKCWSDLGRDEYKVGSLLENKAQNTSKLMSYMLYDATLDNECVDCNVLPLCMGGCPRRKSEYQIDRCTAYKYVLREYIEKIATTLYEKKLVNPELSNAAK